MRKLGTCLFGRKSYAVIGVRGFILLRVMHTKRSLLYAFATKGTENPAVPPSLINLARKLFFDASWSVVQSTFTAAYTCFDLFSLLSLSQTYAAFSCRAPRQVPKPLVGSFHQPLLLFALQALY